MTEIIKDGYLSVKEEGLRAWIWSKRFCVLRDQALTFHRNEVYTCLEENWGRNGLANDTVPDFFYYSNPGSV